MSAQSTDVSYPKVNLDLHTEVGPAESHFRTLDEHARRHPVYWNDEAQGYWVINRYADVMEAALDPATFCNHSIVAVDPNPAYRFLPSYSEPPMLRQYRRPLSQWFSLKHVGSYDDELRALANQVIDKFIDDGECEFLTAFADDYPVRAFCLSVGAPQSDAEFFGSAVRRISGVLFEGDPNAFVSAMADIREYWRELMVDRRKNPRDTETDFTSYMLAERIDGRPLEDDEFLDICLTSTIGSMDTTKSVLGWCLYHLATHPEDRERIVREPQVIPSAVEEFLRGYPILSMARKVTADTDFKGCPMKKGDMVMLNYQTANRDPEQFEDPEQIKLDRNPKNHLAFGRSGHRCIGVHLARRELQLSLEEWQRRIPEYRLNTAEQLTAHGGQVSLLTLPLAWS
jgi:cytochrome P450